MITTEDLRELAQARLEDAKALLSCQRYDGAIYLCGYAIELALKARICKTLKWSGYPSTNREFRDYQSFRTHDLDVLLHLSGYEQEIKLHFLAAWSNVVNWDPSARYQPVGTFSEEETQQMISDVEIILREILRET